MKVNIQITLDKAYQFLFDVCYCFIPFDATWEWHKLGSVHFCWVATARVDLDNDLFPYTEAVTWHDTSSRTFTWIHLSRTCKALSRRNVSKLNTDSLYFLSTTRMFAESLYRQHIQQAKAKAFATNKAFKHTHAHTRHHTNVKQTHTTNLQRPWFSLHI